MKISNLIASLSAEMEQSGDLEVVIPLDTGQYAPVSSADSMPMFLHNGFEPVYDLRPLARQSKHEHEHVLVLLWDEK